MAKGIMRFIMLSFAFMFVIYDITALEIGTSTGSIGVGGSKGVVLSPPTDISFLWLNDTPNSYATFGGNCVKVNALETELEFGACGAGGGGDYLGYYNSSLINSTELEEQGGGILGIKLSWLTTVFDDLFGGKTTDDLTQGSINLYDNQSWNETRANLLYSAGSYAPTQINLTGGTHNGDITNDTAVGYEAGDQICNIEFVGSHFCTEFEVTLYQGDDLNGVDAWIIAGSPKYIPATVPVNDCQGWTYSGTTTALGNYWHFDTDGKGEGRAINCGTALKLACCSY